MGMSTHVVAFKAPDETWLRMKVIYDACRAAKVDPPKEVDKFFNYEAPDDTGVSINLENHECCEEWFKEDHAGYQIDVTKLPPGTTHVRVYNSW